VFVSCSKQETYLSFTLSSFIFMTILHLQYSLKRAIQTTENNNTIWVADLRLS
jgi:hypothetical protein